MKKIALLYMGGTFGCVGEPLSPMPESQFIPALQQILPKDLHIDCFTAPSVKDSSACTAADWFLLIQQIQDLQLLKYQHFIVIHGTDTLSYAAATLSQFLQQSCHVIITGSQYPLLNSSGQDIREFTDALDNLKTSIEYIHKVPTGVYLAFHHQVFHASTALKVHSTALKAFYGTHYQQDVKCKEHSQFIIQSEHIAHIKNLNILNLMLQPIEKNKFTQTLKTVLSDIPHVLILQAYGTGNMTADAEMIEVLQQIHKQGCGIILDTQVAFGGLDQRYAITDWLKDAKILINNTQGHADLYAKILKMYLQYPTANQWHDHWYDHSN